MAGPRFMLFAAVLATEKAGPAVAAQALGEVRLAGTAGTRAKRQGMTAVAASRTQSFRLTDAGCFVAIVRDAGVRLIPTIGHGDYEAESCGGPSAVGLLSPRDPVRFGIVFDASSPNAGVREPVFVNWDRPAHTLAIDDARSTAASRAGATTVAAMRRATR